MRTFRLLAASLLVALSMGVSSCGDDVTNEIIQQEPDNTLELLLGTWQGTGEAEGETLTFNKDDTYTEISENETLNGTFEYFPNRYMFVTYYTTDWGEENTIYTVVKITEKELYLNDNGHSDIVIYKGEFYQFNLSSCIRQQNSLTAQFVSFSLSNLANIFYPPQFLQ